MKSVLALVAGLLMTVGAQAQNRDDLKAGTNQMRLLAGYSQNAPAFGLEYERRTGTFGLGGTLFHSPKNSDANKPQSTSLGIFAASHLVDKNDLDLYIAPGFAVTNMDNITAAGDDETLFGPTLTVGALYTLNPTWGIGFQFTNMYNWFSYKVAGEVNYSNLVLSYNF